MVNYLFAFIILVFGCKSVLSEEGASEVITIYGELAQDSFDVRFDTYNDVKGQKELQRIVFYFDAGIKSGTKIRAYFDKSVNTNTLLVGIAHRGYFRAKRRRDLMEDNANMKQLIDSSIVPYIKATYGWCNKRIIIGHSFGGLWVYRSFFSSDTLFTDYLAISPSLWVDGTKKPLEYGIENISSTNKEMFMYWGGDEEFNYVKGACIDAAKEILGDKVLSGKITTKELKGESHNTTQTPALEDYFSEK
jgi:hypothetical protein